MVINSTVQDKGHDTLLGRRVALMSWQEDALTRLASLTEYGGENINYGTAQGIGHFYGWRTQAISALRAIVGENDAYTTEFESRVTYQNGPDSGIPILRRSDPILKTDTCERLPILSLLRCLAIFSKWPIIF